MKLPWEYRLTLDAPIDLAVEPGFVKATFGTDLKPTSYGNGAAPLDETFRDPITGLVMLRPGFLKSEWTDGWSGLSEFQRASGVWIEHNRFATCMGSMPIGSYEIGYSAYLPQIEPSSGDGLVWALRQNSLMPADAGFAFYCMALKDEISNYNNLWALQWDNIALHFSAQGLLRAYLYDRADLSAEPRFKAAHAIAKPGEQVGRSMMFYFVPIPGVGLLVYHSNAAATHPAPPGSVDKRTANGFLLRWPEVPMETGARTFEAAPVAIALNESLAYVVGFKGIEFSSEGSVADAIFDIGYAPSVEPTTAYYAIGAEVGAVSISVKKPSGLVDWTPGEKQGRIVASLSSGDSRRTPFFGGWAVQWAPVLQEREATPVAVSSKTAPGAKGRLVRLEYSIDDRLRFEGKAELILDHADLIAIASRGDATFRLERRASGSDPWETISGGFATDWELTARQQMGKPKAYYEASVSLRDMSHRLREGYLLQETALDGLTVGAAINAALRMCGFAPIDPLPPEASVVLPIAKEGDQWGWSPPIGATGDDIIDYCLFLMRRQNEEWRLWFDFDAQEWKLTKRPTAPILIEGGVEVGASIRPEPPEGNIVLAMGLTRPDSQGTRLPQGMVNQDSLTEPASPDYLGRTKPIWFFFGELGAEADVNLAVRRLYDAAAHRRLKFSAVKKWPPLAEHAPDVRIRIEHPDGSGMAEGYCKKLSVVFDDKLCQATYDCDDVWASEIWK